MEERDVEDLFNLCSQDFYYDPDTMVLTSRGFIRIEELKRGDTLWYVVGSELRKTSDFKVVKRSDVYLSRYKYASGNIVCSEDASNFINVKPISVEYATESFVVGLDINDDLVRVNEDILLLYRFLIGMYTEVDSKNHIFRFSSEGDDIESLQLFKYIIKLNKFISNDIAKQPKLKVSKPCNWNKKSLSLTTTKEELFRDMLEKLPLSGAFLSTLLKADISKLYKPTETVYYAFNPDPNKRDFSMMILFYLYAYGINALGRLAPNRYYKEFNDYQIMAGKSVANDYELNKLFDKNPEFAVGVKFPGGDLITITESNNYCRVLRAPAMKL